MYVDRESVMRGLNDPTIRGFVIFRDKDGEECAIDDGIAELSCELFKKQLKIRPIDFKIKDCESYPHRLWCSPFFNEHYGYRIEFKLTEFISPRDFPPYPSPSRRPQTVKFKLGNLEAKCILDENRETRESSGEGGSWGLVIGDKVKKNK